jgi:Cdc6-like AAA superfamily ATPase
MATLESLIPAVGKENNHHDENEWDLRFVSLEYSAEGERGSEGSGHRRVHWPCLYFASVNRMVSFMVTQGVIPPEGGKKVHLQCHRLRLELSESRRQEGKRAGPSVVYLLGEPNTQPGAQERAKYELNMPIWFPDEEPIDFYDYGIEVEEEHEQLRTFLDAFNAAMREDALKIIEQAERVSGSWWFKPWAQVIEHLGQSDALSWGKSPTPPLSPPVPEETRTPPPVASKATAPPLVTEARPDHPSVGYPIRSTSEAAAEIQATVQPKVNHAHTPAAASAASAACLHAGDNDAVQDKETEAPAKKPPAAVPGSSEEVTSVPEGSRMDAKDLGSSYDSETGSEAPGDEGSGAHLSEQAVGNDPRASGQEDAASFSPTMAENTVGPSTNETLGTSSTSEERLQCSRAGLFEARVPSRSDPPNPSRDVAVEELHPNVEMASKLNPKAATTVEPQAAASPSVEADTAFVLSPRVQATKIDGPSSETLSTEDGHPMTPGDRSESKTNFPKFEVSSGSSTVVTIDSGTSSSPSFMITGSASKFRAKKGQTPADTGMRRKDSVRKARKTSPKSSKTTASPKAMPLRLKPIPAFAEVKHALEKAGFRFRYNRYERPSGGGSLEAFASEGDLRVDLCAYGLNDYDGWTDRERALVKKWIQYTHVDVNSGRSYHVLNDSEFSSYSKRLGIVKQHDFYKFPEGSPPQALFTPKDLRDYLSRFGLPAGCSVEELNPVERLSFDVYVSGSSKPLYVSPIHQFSEKTECMNPTHKLVSMLFSERIERGDISSSGRKRRPPSGRESVGSDVYDGRLTAEPIDVFKEPSKRKRDKAATESAPGKRQITHKPPESSPPDEATESSASSQPFVPPASDIVTPPLHRLPLSGEAEPRTYKEMLTECRDLVTKPHALVYPPNSDFDRNVKRIEVFVKALIDSEGSHGSVEGSPASLYVCGAPGLGKTAAVRSCCERATSEFFPDDESGLRKPLVCYINGSSMEVSFDPELLLIQRMAHTLEIRSENPSITTIKSTMTRKKAQVLIVVDEIDMLLSEREDASSYAATKHEGVLVTLAGWASDADLPVGFIGIANRKGNTKFERLKQLGGVSDPCVVHVSCRRADAYLNPSLYIKRFSFIVQFQEVIDFKAYSKDDISYIVGELVSPSIIGKDALAFLAAKTSQIRGGDLRFAIERVSIAASMCLKSMTDSELSTVANPDKPPIKVPIFHQIFMKQNNRVKDIVRGLPASGKAMLIVLATLSQEEVHATTIRNLKNFANMATNNNDITSTEDFIIMLSTLCDNGLIELAGGGKFEIDSKSHAELSELSIKLGLALDEVNAVVNDDLCKNHRPYAELRDKVKSNRDLFKSRTTDTEKSRRKK